jgi:hypothetical protein
VLSTAVFGFSTSGLVVAGVAGTSAAAALSVDAGSFCGFR